MKTQQIFSADATTILNLQHQGAISIAQLKHVPINSLEFISVHRAFNQNKIKVEEVSESGNVNELLVTNLSNEHIFIMQNTWKSPLFSRVLSGRDIEKPPGTGTLIPPCFHMSRNNGRGD